MKKENSTSAQSTPISQMSTRAIDTFDEGVNMVRAESEKILESKKAAAVHYLEDYANAVKDVAKSLEKKHHEEATPFLRSASTSLSQIASILESKTVNSVAEDVVQLARQNPMMFTAGAFMAGFLISRFVKASPQE